MNGRAARRAKWRAVGDYAVATALVAAILATCFLPWTVPSAAASGMSAAAGVNPHPRLTKLLGGTPNLKG